MPTYMVQASYTNIAWNKLVQRPENRMEALKPVVEKLGGQVGVESELGKGSLFFFTLPGGLSSAKQTLLPS